MRTEAEMNRILYLIKRNLQNTKEIVNLLKEEESEIVETYMESLDIDFLVSLIVGLNQNKKTIDSLIEVLNTELSELSKPLYWRATTEFGSMNMSSINDNGYVYLLNDEGDKTQVVHISEIQEISETEVRG